ncbi:hypothetical protein SAMN05444411_102170 [Lutibacter oricola]|uniref:Uncharacterized protein n=1 Tax=Lutibacter oricola TaxID=762486 RepID=A0A1H2WDI6_9FLAO|nr:hypothetical protein [Lutibacter oricola]SDW78587.1 hypothetical protein SAMN05444411_102170 [Lutibacter oricola]
MKRLLLLILTATLFSCNDGNFDIPSFEFESTVNTCGEYVLYRANEDDTEVIVLTLSSSDLGETIGEEQEHAISSTYNVVYRAFDSGFSSSYFCQDIPPTTPNVLKELNAESGTIIITTSAGDPDGFVYDIVIEDLVFIDDKDKIVYNSFDFGSIEIDE